MHAKNPVISELVQLWKDRETETKKAKGDFQELSL